jgi:DHA2 family methylenomycin A resistance protein-like MFS transporter
MVQAVGFAFMGGYYGRMFLFSLYYQQQGLSPLCTGLAFLPMTLLIALTSLVAGRVAARVGTKLPTVAGQAIMAAGLLALCLAATLGADTLVLAVLLLDSVPAERAGTAGGVLNTSRQIGGALAIAVYGALLATQGFLDGLRTSLLIAGLLLAATTLASFTLRPAPQH